MTVRAKQVQSRHKTGSSIIEFGPCLLVLVLFIFFPFVNLLTLGLTYSSIAALNYAQVREAAVSTHKEALNPEGAVLKQIPYRRSRVGKAAFNSFKKVLRIELLVAQWARAYRSGEDTWQSPWLTLAVLQSRPQFRVL